MRAWIAATTLLTAYVGSGLAVSPPQAASSTAQAALPRVRLVATGGTIFNRSGGRLTPQAVGASIPRNEKNVRPEFEEFTNVPSGSLTLKQWIAFANRINSTFADEP